MPRGRRQQLHDRWAIQVVYSALQVGLRQEIGLMTIEALLRDRSTIGTTHPRLIAGRDGEAPAL
jgi:hypothetical protein